MKNKICGIVGFVLLIIFLWAQNNLLTVTYFDYESEKVPKSFNEFKILQVSDLHNKEFGKDQSKLIKKTESLKPDIIVVTGDVIDKKRTNDTNLNICLKYLTQAVKIAPVYFVTGNHEGSSSVFTQLKKSLLQIGVTVLDNKSEKISHNGSSINLIGINDISFFGDSNVHAFETTLKRLVDKDSNCLNILLSHKPNFFNIYQENHIDLALTGHTHGGQIVIPFVGGIINVDNNKNMKKMLAGIHTRNGTTMIISRGLGNSLFPLRFLNYPELVLIKLKNK